MKHHQLWTLIPAMVSGLKVRPAGITLQPLSINPDTYPHVALLKKVSSFSMWVFFITTIKKKPNYYNIAARTDEIQDSECSWYNDATPFCSTVIQENPTRFIQLV